VRHQGRAQVHRLTRAAALTAAIAVAVAAGESASAQPSGTPEATASREVTLSHSHTLTRWAYPVRPAVVRTEPRPGARGITRLHFVTEDGYPEIYVLLAERRVKGTTWVHLRVPGRPNGRHGWVPRDALGPYRSVRTFIVVDRRRLRLTLYRSGRPVLTVPVGIGKSATPTPAGRFWIREKLTVRGRPAYGPRALGTSAYAPYLTDWPNGGVIGLHGTDQPHLIPGRPSHGCIRLRNRDIMRLYRLVPRGTPVDIV
jgi:hypothetical protein